MSEMREYILDFMSRRELSMTRLSELLGYKSKTSLVRLMEDGSREKSVLQFETAMNRCFDLTAQEQSGLHRAVQIAIRGRTEYLAEEEMWHFVQGAEASVGTKLSVTECGTGAQIDLFERYSGMTDVQILLLNCHSVAVFPILRALLAREDVEVEHFICSDGNAAKTICAVNSLMPVFYEKRYHGFTYLNNPYDDATAPKGVMKADLMAVSYVLPDGERGEDVVVFSGRSEGTLLAHRGQRGVFVQSLGLKREMYTPLKRTYFHCSAFENYVQFSFDYAELEKNRAIWKIKPDVGVDWIPVQILASALMEGSMADGELDESVVRALYEIYDQRFHNTISKRQPAHAILKHSAMRRFAMTGRTSDHFWAMRPFTPRERAAILTELLRLQQRNPYFHIYFLRDDGMLRDAEITLYDDLGILMTEAHTDYDLAAGHSEVMLAHPELMRLFREFMMKSLVKHHALPEEETCRILAELIEIAENV